MQLEHILGIVVAFLVSILLVWFVWTYFCQQPDKESENENDKSDLDDESYSSTYVITNDSEPRKHRRKRKQRQRHVGHHSETTDEESDCNNHERIQRKKKSHKKLHVENKLSACQYQQSDNGIFSEWSPKRPPPRDHSPSVVTEYRKSPTTARRHSETVIDMNIPPNS